MENKINKQKRDFIVGMICIILLIIVGSVLFGLYRPFTKWVKIECSEENGTLVRLEENNTFLYRYEIDGKSYEKIYKFVNVGPTYSSSGNDGSWKVIYVNANNPQDVKRGVFGNWIILFVSILFIVIGVLSVVVISINYAIKNRTNKKWTK